MPTPVFALYPVSYEEVFCAPMDEVRKRIQKAYLCGSSQCLPFICLPFTPRSATPITSVYLVKAKTCHISSSTNSR